MADEIEPHARPKGGIGHGLQIEPHARPKGGIGHALQIEITLFWGRDALATKHFRLGSRVRIGSVAGCDLLVPREALGIDELDIVESRDGAVVIHPPPGSSPSFVLAHEHVAEIKMGAFSVAISVGESPGRIPRVLGLTESWGLGVSALAHGAVLAAFALFLPALGQAEQEGVGRDQLISMKTYLDAAVERVPTVVGTGNKRGSSAANSDDGEAAKGVNGPMGPVQPVIDKGHWTAKGESRDEDVQLARDRALGEARDFGMVGLIESAPMSDPNAPVVPWGSLLAGADKESHLGSIWGNDIGDTLGTGLGLSGTGEGGGGKGEGIGIADVGTYGHYGSACGCEPLSHGAHEARGLLGRLTDAGVSGHLDPAVIQRIVRQNSGRMVNCYQDGLRNNPGLAGRVAVQFMIGRDGSVTMSQDSAGSDLADEKVRQCVVRSFYNISFPEPRGGIVTVLYPLTFSPSD